VSEQSLDLGGGHAALGQSRSIFMSEIGPVEVDVAERLLSCSDECPGQWVAESGGIIAAHSTFIDDVRHLVGCRDVTQLREVLRGQW
jgi:hypothetical protein